MSEELDDELITINAIYDGALVKLLHISSVYAITFPALPSISLRIEFPPDYSDAPPSILGTQAVGDGVAKGAGDHVVQLAREILGEVYNPGMPCVFDLIEEVNSRVRHLGLDVGSRDTTEQDAQAHGQQASIAAGPSSDSNQSSTDLGPDPPWTLSEVISEKKSVFVARSAPVTSVDEAKQYLNHLLATDKKVAKATHNITAWRIEGTVGVYYQDCDDDGETAAGSRLLHLLELMGVWNVMVVVTRFYGGVQLGPDRFRIINQTARDALVKGGFDQYVTKDGSKKKSKR